MKEPWPLTFLVARAKALNHMRMPETGKTTHGLPLDFLEPFETGVPTLGNAHEPFSAHRERIATETSPKRPPSSRRLSDGNQVVAMNPRILKETATTHVR